MAFGNNPTTTTQTALSTNQLPISTVYTPNTAGGNTTAVEGGPVSTDSNNNKSAPIGTYTKDGGNVALGTTTDAAYSGSGAATEIAILKKIVAQLAATLPVSGTVTANAGTNLNTSALALETGGNLTSIKADADTIVASVGAISDAAYSGSGNGSEIAILKKLVAQLAGTISTSIASALPAGSNVIGHVIADSGSTTAVTSLPALPAGSNLIGNVELVDSAGTNKATISAGGALKVDGSAVTQPISASSLPLPTGAATAAKQPALGTAGSASTDVLTVQGIASMTALKVDGSGVTQPVSGTVTVTQATASNLKVDLSGTSANATAIKVDGSAVTQPVSGTISDQHSNVTGDYDTGAGTQNLTMYGLALPASGGAVSGGTSTNPIRTDPTGVTTQPISAASLPLPTGASTSAKQPALGTAGSASTDVLTVQGITSMTALKVDGSGVTQPVSGTVTVTQGTAANLKVDLSGTSANATALKVDGSAVTQPVSGTITANAGSGTFTVSDQHSNNTSDYDTGAGTQTMTMYGLALPASGGSVPGGTATNPIKIDPTGTTVQPVSASSLPLPTGAATSAKQPAIGTAGSSSVDVLSIQGIASGTPIPITGSITATNPSVSTDGSAIPASSTLIGASDGTNLQQLLVESSTNRNLRIGIYNGATEASVTGANALKVDGSAVTQPISAASLPLPTGASTSAKQPALGTAGTASSDVLTVQGITSMTALKVDGSGVTQPVSGTITVQQSTASSLKVDLSGTSANATAIKVDGSAVTQPISGTVTANAGTGTFTVSDQHSNNTTDYDTGAGTQTMTMYGLALPASGGSVAGGTATNPVRTDPTGTTTQPISGTVTVTQATASNLKVDLSGTAANATALKVDGSAVTQPVSGTITANVGTTNGLALDTSVNGLIVSQASTTSGEKGPLIQGAVTTAAPTYTTAQTNPLSLTTAGALRTDATATTQPVSGTVTANAGTNMSTAALALETGGNLATLAGAITSAKVQSNTAQINGVAPLMGNGISGTGAQRVTIASDSTGQIVLAAGSAVIGHVIADSGSTTAATQATASNLNAQVVGAVASAGSNAGNPVKVGGAFNTTQPTVTTGQIVDAQMTARGAQIVATGVDTFNVTASGTVTANAGTNLNTSLLALETGGNLATLAGSVTSAKVQTNTAQINGVAPSMGNGVSGTGVQRVTIASDSTGQITLAAGSAVVGHVIADSGSTTAVTQATASSLNAQVVGAVASAGSNAGNPLKVGGAFNTTQPTVTNGQVVDAQMTARGAQIVATGTDTFSVTANAGTNLNTSLLALETGGNLATLAGAVTSAKMQSNVAQINGSTTVTAATGVQKVGIVGNTGASIDSTVGAGTAPTNAVVSGAIYSSTAPAPTTGQAMALQTDQAGNLKNFQGTTFATLSAWNSATSLNTTQNIFTNSGAESVVVQLTQTTTITVGAITFEVTYDNGSNWSTIPANAVFDPTSTTFAALSLPYTLQASTNKIIGLNMNGATGLRIKLSTAITGSGTVTPAYALQSYSPADTVIALSPTAANFNTTTNLSQIGGTNVGVTNPLYVSQTIASGAVSVFGSNPSALTANTDASFKWGGSGTTVVNHIMLQNNTALNVLFDLDVASTAGSPICAPGQTIFLDVQTTALHVQANGTPNLNGTTASNIVIRGWL